MDVDRGMTVPPLDLSHLT